MLTESIRQAVKSYMNMRTHQVVFQMQPATKKVVDMRCSVTAVLLKLRSHLLIKHNIAPVNLHSSERIQGIQHGTSINNRHLHAIY